MLTTLTFNIANVPIRHERLHGRSYLVAPLAMLTEGVHKGSGGPLLYKQEDCKRAVPAWNMKPIVVYHPTINGQGVSACDPDILERQQVGMLMNTRWDHKLRSEAWIDEARARSVDDRVLKALEENLMMEVSTGLFTDNVGGPGEWNGEAYDAIATNHQPDHLALLPDKIGACSIADGAGLLQLNEAAQVQGTPEAFQTLGKAVALLARGEGQGKAGPKQGDGGTDVCVCPKCGATTEHERGKPCTNEECPKCGANMVGGAAVANALQAFYRVLGNAMSYGNVRDALDRALRDKLGARVDVWLQDVYDGFFVYENDADKKLYKQDYSVDSGAVEIVGQPEEVTRVTEYRTLAGKFVGNESKEKSAMKKQLVDALIANERTQWGEEDREALMALEEDALKKMVPVFNEPEPEAEPKKKTESKEDEEKSTVPSGPLTMEQYVKAAPPEYRDVLVNALTVHQERREQLIASITANKANKFTKEFLATKGIQELQGLAALAGAEAEAVPVSNVVPMFAGAAVPAGPTSNVDTDETPLQMPVINFGG